MDRFHHSCRGDPKDQSHDAHVFTPTATPSRTALERCDVLLLLLQFPLQRFACHRNISLSQEMLLRYHLARIPSKNQVVSATIPAMSDHNPQ